MKLDDIREAYLSFFEKKMHTRLPSASLIPENDNSLLIINSGMAPLKPYFIGKETPPNVRVTSCQKCIRTGDIENVGKTERHGTFFEMLGNFSFGEYFKEEATAWALEFCLDILKLPMERLYFSIYEEDEETALVWQKLGIPQEKIVRLGKEDNFWEVGLGPCGPCSELYYDRGMQHGCGSKTCAPGCDCDRFMEFWNLVFTQFNKEADGTYSELASKNIDTGMGLERMALIMQEVSNIFDIDAVQKIIKKVEVVSDKKYLQNADVDISIKVIADHARSITFMLLDGILPSNEGRGYVLRRLLRRASLHGKKIGIEDNFLEIISNVVIENFAGAYPSLLERKTAILKYLNIEEEAFNKTISAGLTMFESLALKGAISGEDAFKMYDTYGFPIDLLLELAEEKNIKVDIDKYELYMEEQKNRARAARTSSSFLEGDIFEGIAPTIFEGYTKLKIQSKIVKIIADDDNVKIITEKTPFYAESGGQVGDEGEIRTDSSLATIFKTVKNGDKTVHIGKMVKGSMSEGEIVTLEVSTEIRRKTSANHSATHLLHKALKEVLGEDAAQKGSEVSEKRLRFDFTHFEAITPQELEEIETRVNNFIAEDYEIVIEEKNIEEAKKEGATALFGEKYGDVVRVVKIGPSIELCGGTHLSKTSNVLLFKIVSEGSIAAGVRRIEAVTGSAALKYMNEKEKALKNIEAILKTSGDNTISKVSSLISENKLLSDKNLYLESSLIEAKYLSSLLEKVKVINNKNVLLSRVDGISANSMLLLAESISKTVSNCVVVLIGDFENKVSIAALVTDDLVKEGVNAGNLAREMAKITGGGGGGKPSRATAGGKNKEKIEEALLTVERLL